MTATFGPDITGFYNEAACSVLVLLETREDGCFRELAALYSDCLTQIPLYTLFGYMLNLQYLHMVV